MEPHVADAVRDVRHRRDQAGERRLVHAAVAERALGEPFGKLGVHPRVVAELDPQRLALHPLAQVLQVPLGSLLPLEGPRELGQEPVILPRVLQGLHDLKEALVERGLGRVLVGHGLVELDDEAKAGRGLPFHLGEHARLRDAVVGGVHLDAAELGGVVGKEFAAPGAGRIERPHPVGKGVARCADEHLGSGAHGFFSRGPRGLSCVGSGADGSAPSP